MVFGLASGLGFFYLRNDALSPTRMFHGRTRTLEEDFFRNTGIPFEDRIEPDDGRAWLAVKHELDAGRPVMVSTDTFYLGYHRTRSHFPGHRAVVVGYDEDRRKVFLADRKFPDLQCCSFEELRRARNADDYPMSCMNQYADLPSPVVSGRPRVDAIRVALARNCDAMLAPAAEWNEGVAGMHELAADLPCWPELEDWSWAARFGYQIVIKRGAGGSFFRSLYADFLAEAAMEVPAIEAAGFPKRMTGIAARWRELAEVLKEQSERERCDPRLFVRAGALVHALAKQEADFFEELRRTTASDAFRETAAR